MLSKLIKIIITIIFFFISIQLAFSYELIIPKKKPSILSLIVIPQEKPAKDQTKIEKNNVKSVNNKIEGILIPKKKPLVVKKQRLKLDKKTKYYSERDFEFAKQAIKFGAEGIGLCRTEHMFFDEKRILAMRKMILSDSEGDRRDAVMGLLPFQKEDFKGILKAMEGKPVTIRLLDPPLHEFITLDEKVRNVIRYHLRINYVIQRLKKYQNEFCYLQQFQGLNDLQSTVIYPP